MEKIKPGIIICDRYTTCTGGNMEYASEEIKKNGVTRVHMNTWDAPFLCAAIQQTLTDEKSRLNYD